MGKDIVRVLMVIHNIRVANGVSSFVMNYYRRIDHTKIKMDFVMYERPRNAYLNEIESIGGKVYVLPPIKNIYAHLRECNKILKNEKYDVIHDNTLLISLPLMICALCKKVPVRILHSHSSKLGKTLLREKRNQLFLPLLRRTVNYYVACSELAGKAMFKNRKYTIVSNVINVQKCFFDLERRLTVRSNMQIDGKCIIGTVARIGEEKNPFFAVDVFAKVVEKYPNTEYWWIGSGNLDDKLAMYIKRRGLSDRIKLLGAREDVIDLYHAIDVFFLPSLFEGLGIAAVEAQAFGLPCVISDSAPKELVYTDLVKFISLSDDIDMWADYIISRCKMNSERRSYSYELMQSEFSDVTAGEKLFDFYKNAIMKMQVKYIHGN